MIYCITLIIIVALICATRLYPLWIEQDRKKAAKAMQLVAKIREENASLRKQNIEIIDEYLKSVNESSDSFNRAWDKLYEISEKIGVKIP